MKLSIAKKYALTSVFAISAMATIALTYADDTEIYTTVNNSTNTAASNHNILFVMDTSGSMAWSVAGLSSAGGYDPAEDYGDSDDKVYVYDSEFEFTGNTIENDQNKCQTMTNVFGSTTTYPVYYDQGLQWQQTTDVVDGGETCNTTTASGVTFPSRTVFESKKDRWVTLLETNIPAGGGDLEIVVNASRKVKVYVETWRSSNTTDDDYYCYDKTADPNRTCSGDIEDDHDRLKVWVRTKKDNTSITVSGSISGATTRTCTDNPDTSIATNDWKSVFINTTNSSSIFECKNDGGSHGIDGVSSNTYVQDCPYGTECTTPKYNSNSNNEINWNSSPYQYFVPGNYHDYLENGGTEDISGLLADEQDATTYCSQSNDDRIGDVFIDSDTKLVFECFERIQVMKDAVSNLVSSLAAAPVNVGLMRFNREDDDGTGTQGGTVVNAIGNVATNSTAFSTALDALPASGGTPLSESLYEAYRYYSGKSLDYGRTINCGSSGVECTTGAAKSGNNYISPITSSCQSNSIIFLSDGDPSSSDGGRDSEIRTAAGVTDCGTVGGAGKCLDEMALAMANRDMNLNVSGTNTVKTYTIGLDIDLPLLEDTADSGKGEYFTATSLSDLEDAFQNIIVDILTDAGSFTAPAVSVNQFNESRNRNEVYYAMFEPSGTSRWAGNVKKYFLSDSGELLDANGVRATETGTGVFKETAKSFWSTTIDGRTVGLGGAAGKLSTSRNIYASFDTDDPTIPLQLTTGNFSSISLNSLRVSSDNERADYLNWLLGKDVFDDNRDNITNEAARFLADPLHSKPEVVTFGGTAESPEDVLFYATNMGTLHALDPADGSELWAYLAEDHRPNLREYILAPNSPQHVYGLDGQMTVLTTEANNSSPSDFSLAEAKLYIGERRGGSSYYGFDVSNARIASSTPTQLDGDYDTPFKKLFTIKGVYSGNPANTANPSDSSVSTGFTDLGQTWAKMQATYMNLNGVKTRVLIFPGGYDPRHDDIDYSSTAPTDDSNGISDYGNAIYIVNADTGALLYSIGNNSDDDDSDPLNSSARNARIHNLPLPMMDSIVAAPNLVDTRGDGFVDIIYAIDIKGHIWRIDIDSDISINATGFAKGDMIANLSSSTENRRFYNQIDVSRSNINSGSNHYNLVVGSGYRASPSTTEDWRNGLYFIFDDYTSTRALEAVDEPNRYKYVSETSNGTTSYRTIMLSDILETSLIAPKTKADAPYGFYLKLSAGEKIIQPSLTFNSRVAVNSYSTSSASGQAANVCGGSLGSSSSYVLDITSGESVLTAEDLSGETIIIEAGTEINVNDVTSFISASGQEVIIADHSFVTDADGIIQTDPDGGVKVKNVDADELAGAGGGFVIILQDGFIVCDGSDCDNNQILTALIEDLELRRAYRSDWQEVK